jgi:hypothetical protein
MLYIVYQVSFSFRLATMAMLIHADVEPKAETDAHGH